MVATKKQLIEALRTVLYQDSPGKWYSAFIECYNVAMELPPEVIEAMENYEPED